MDGYPAYSLEHNAPLITLFGLSPTSTSKSSLPPDLKDQAVLLRSDLPPVDSRHAGALLKYIQDKDALSLPWNGSDISSRYRFRVKTAGRTYLLPPRHARLPEDIGPSQPPGALHSPFSPLSPACHLYPDGIIDSGWLEKHQDFIPSVFLCFYSLTSDATLATLQDNQIKTDIGAMRNGLLQLGYKSRVFVAILSDQRISSLDGTQERLENIKKGSGLDAKSFFFLPFPGSQEEMERMTDNMLAMIYTQAVEYYRDLGRRARKKKGRGLAPQPTVPPTSGTSQTLSLSGWNARYDFKSGVFAEFRQEMDQALRSFELAYEAVMGPDILDMIPSWSPRWNEARQLTDIITVRCLRCMLWNGQTSAAARRWQAHRDRIADLIDRRGRGTNNYGWQAWEARWAVLMAQLIEKAEITELAPSSPALFLPPEKPVMGERLQPWDMLHHPGYWYRIAASHLYSRRALAHEMPEEDRRAPDTSPASKVAGKAFTYDTYMCPEPHEEYPLTPGGGVNHTKMIIDCLTAAAREFMKRGQTRLSTELALDCAREYFISRQWPKVLDLLRPLWDDSPFRAESWLDISEELAWMLRAAAHQTGEANLLLAIDWELMNSKFNRRPNWHYDLSKSLDGVAVDEKPSVEIVDESSCPLLSMSFVFRSDEGKAGKTCQAQLAITSHAFPGSPPISLQSIQLKFEGSIRTILLKDDASRLENKQQKGTVILSTILLQEASPGPGQTEEEPEPELSSHSEAAAPFGMCDLTLLPGHTMVYEMAVPLREPGIAMASSATLSISYGTFDLNLITNFRYTAVAGVWYLPGKSTEVPRANSHSIRILPRPPNLEIRLQNSLGQYYTNEPIDVPFEIVNAEDADARVKLDVTLSGDEPPGFKLLVGEDEMAAAGPDTDESKILGVPLGVISTTGVVRATVKIDPIDLSATYDLMLKASYYLVTDPATPIIQTLVYSLSLSNPFEANYDLLPRLNLEPWPSIFDYEGVQSLVVEDGTYMQPRGLSQTWCLVTRYASFALEDLAVKDVDIVIAPTPGVFCHTSKSRTLLGEGKLWEDGSGLRVKPKTIEEAQFVVRAQRVSLDERDPVGLDVSFVIKWSRLTSVGDNNDGAGKDFTTPVNTTTLPVPRLSIFGTEPRVLASVSYSQDDPDLVQLSIVIENASNHFLTFGLNMEPGEGFAFSGPKMTTMHLLPVSRRSIAYRLLPLVRGTWVKPNLTVRDKYFQKLLRIIPTEGMKLDKEGFLVWVPPATDDE